KHLPANLFPVFAVSLSEVGPPLVISAPLCLPMLRAILLLAGNQHRAARSRAWALSCGGHGHLPAFAHQHSTLRCNFYASAHASLAWLLRRMLSSRRSTKRRCESDSRASGISLV